MRGELGSVVSRCMLQYRFIPTCVGNWSWFAFPFPAVPVHPHMRGELLKPPMNFTKSRGSSPHAWGTGQATLGGLNMSRFIPTCVGNCCKRNADTDAPAVHPHMRGELLVRRPCERLERGSSPHAWGTDRTQFLTPKFPRFIPTCVGNWRP